MTKRKILILTKTIELQEAVRCTSGARDVNMCTEYNGPISISVGFQQSFQCCMI